MSTPKFITLNSNISGERTRINASFISEYWECGSGSEVHMSNGNELLFAETPEQIDALLATPAPDALVGELVEAERPLREFRHPYYGAEGYTEKYASWSEFMLKGAPDRDPDMNLLYRWDWTTGDGREELVLFYVLPRKSTFGNVRITVRPEDDAEIRAWLLTKLEYLLTLWAPLRLAKARAVTPAATGKGE